MGGKLIDGRGDVFFVAVGVYKLFSGQPENAIHVIDKAIIAGPLPQGSEI